MTPLPVSCASVNVCELGVMAIACVRMSLSASQHVGVFPVLSRVLLFFTLLTKLAAQFGG
jgi:hypothetical protein